MKYLWLHIYSFIKEKKDENETNFKKETKPKNAIVKELKTYLT